MQALGYAGDLTINGKRDDVLITREVNGERQVTHIDLTSAEFMKSPYYFVKPNDVYISNPNKPKVSKFWLCWKRWNGGNRNFVSTFYDHIINSLESTMENSNQNLSFVKKKHLRYQKGISKVCAILAMVFVVFILGIGQCLFLFEICPSYL